MITIPQNETEWKQACATVVTAMQAHVKPFVTPLSNVTRNEDSKPVEGSLLGTGNYISVLEQNMLISNEHNLAMLEKNSVAMQFHGNESVFITHSPTYSLRYPWDVGFSRIKPEVWNLPALQPHNAVPIPQSRLTAIHKPVKNELLFFMGYAQEGSTFLYKSLFSRRTAYMMHEVPLPDGWGDDRYHFALDYRPDLAETVGSGSGLPRPKGFSGSLVWNTRYVECVTQAVNWSPECAEVTGIVWGWPSCSAAILMRAGRQSG